MKSKKRIAIIFILLLLSSCNFDEKQLNFPKEITYFEDDFVSHFPSKVPIEYSQLVVSQNLSNSHPYVWLKYYINQSHLDSTLIALEREAIEIYSSEDSCLLVIDRHLNESNWIDVDKMARMPKIIKIANDPCFIGKLPVPNFYKSTWRETETPTGLTDYTLFILDAKSGIFMDKNKLPNGLYTPEDWEHGYTKGVALNKSSGAIIYWADIW